MADLRFKEICLLNEVETAIKLIKKGMSELQAMTVTNRFYHVPILLLSTAMND